MLASSASGRIGLHFHDLTGVVEMGGIGIWQLVIVLLIVFLLFGTKRLKGLGSDVGEAIQGFRKSMGGDHDACAPGAAKVQQQPSVTAQAAQQPQADRQA